jgi:hypothetical protein
MGEAQSAMGESTVVPFGLLDILLVGHHDYCTICAVTTVVSQVVSSFFLTASVHGLSGVWRPFVGSVVDLVAPPALLLPIGRDRQRCLGRLITGTLSRLITGTLSSIDGSENVQLSGR